MRSARRAALILALAIVALAPRPAFAQQSGPTYVVQEGDTLTGIAQRFGISVDDLAAANGLNDPSSIFPGMSLSLPGFEGVSGILETRPVGAPTAVPSFVQELRAERVPTGTRTKR